MIGVSLIAAMTVLPIVGAPRFRYDALARVEGRYRDPGNYRITPPPQDATSPPEAPQLQDHAWDLDSEATLRIAAVWRRARIAVGYGPRYAIGDIFGDTTRSLLHRADGLITLTFPRVELSFSEYANYGEISYAGITERQGPPGAQMMGMQPPGMTQGATLQPQPITNELAYVSSDTTLTSAIRASRRTRLILTTAYSLSGGADQASRRIMPRSESARASAAFEVDATRRDTLTSSVEGSYIGMTSVRVEPGMAGEPPVVSDAPPINTKILRIGEAWQRRWSRTGTTALLGGVEVIPTPARPDPENLEGPPIEAATHVYPFGSALITQTWAGPGHSRFAGGANLSISTLVDRLTGFPDQRWQAGADVTWTIRPWALRGGFGHSQSVDRRSPTAVQVTTLDLSATYDITRMLAFESGLRMFQQEYTATPTTPTVPIGNIVRPDTLRWVAFVALSFHLGERDF